MVPFLGHSVVSNVGVRSDPIAIVAAEEPVQEAAAAAAGARRSK